MFSEVTLLQGHVEAAKTRLLLLSVIRHVIDTTLPQEVAVLVVSLDNCDFFVEDFLALEVFGAGVLAAEVADVVFEGVSFKLVPLRFGSINEGKKKGADENCDEGKNSSELEHILK